MDHAVGGREHSEGWCLGFERVFGRVYSVSSLSLYNIVFHCKALVWESIIIVLPPPPVKPTVLQYYCTNIAQYTPPPLTPPCVCHTPKNIGDGNIV